MEVTIGKLLPNGENYIGRINGEEIDIWPYRPTEAQVKEVAAEMEENGVVWATFTFKEEA